MIKRSISHWLTGENWVAFRTEQGKAAILDAYCPHLGAHLAIGGKVVGNCIECPFHGWQFRAQDGQCTAVPYAKKGGSRPFIRPPIPAFLLLFESGAFSL